MHPLSVKDVVRGPRGVGRVRRRRRKGPEDPPRSGRALVSLRRVFTLCVSRPLRVVILPVFVKIDPGHCPIL